MEGGREMSISRLIIPPHTAEHQPVINYSKNNNINIYAQTFINSLTIAQRKQFKKMIENGIEVGRSVAETYGVPLKQFIEEVRSII